MSVNRNKDTNEGFTVVNLCKAIQDENLQLVREILNSGLVISDKYIECYRSYNCASEDTDDKIEILKLLLESEASLACNEYAAIQNLLPVAQKRTIETVLKYKNDFFKRYNNGNTMLHYLAYNEDPDIVELLRDKNFDVNLRNNRGHTPLFAAVECGNAKMVKFLFENGLVLDNPDDSIDLITDAKVMTQIYFSILMSNGGLNRDFQEIIELIYIHSPIIAWPRPWLLQQLAHARDLHGSINIQSTKPILSILALQVSLNVNSNNDHIKMPDFISEECIKHYERSLEKLKSMTMFESVSLYDILTESPENISYYFCNLKFNPSGKLSELDRFCSYYLKIIRHKIFRAIDIAKERQETRSIISKITGLDFSAYPNIIIQIANLLNRQNSGNLRLAYRHYTEYLSKNDFSEFYDAITEISDFFTENRWLIFDGISNFFRNILDNFNFYFENF